MALLSPLLSPGFVRNNVNIPISFVHCSTAIFIIMFKSIVLQAEDKETMIKIHLVVERERK